MQKEKRYILVFLVVIDILKEKLYNKQTYKDRHKLSCNNKYVVCPHTSLQYYNRAVLKIAPHDDRQQKKYIKRLELNENVKMFMTLPCGD